MELLILQINQNNLNMINYYLYFKKIYIIYKMLHLLIILILTLLVIYFIINRNNKNKKEKFAPDSAEVSALNEWNENAMSYLCNVSIDSIPDKYSFVKFCDRMITHRDYKKFITLLVNKPTDFKTKEFNSNDFYYAPATRHEWLKIKNKKALGKTLAFIDNKALECEKLAKEMPNAVAFNATKKGCTVKNKKVLVKSKGTNVYIKEDTIQYTISFWLKIDTVLPNDRNILWIGDPKNKELRLPSIHVVKNTTALEFSISTEQNNRENMRIATGYMPFKKWALVTYTLQGKTLRGYINSRLIEHQTLSGYPIKLNSTSKMTVKKKLKGSSAGITAAKMRIIPVFVPQDFIKNILVEEDPTEGIDYRKCLKKNFGMGRDGAHKKCTPKLFKGVDGKQSENNVNGRDLQLLNDKQFTDSSLNDYYRKPSFRIRKNGIAYLSGTIADVKTKGNVLVLPKEVRPDKKLYFNSGSEDKHVRVTINPNGFLQVGENSNPNGTLNLDTIRYPINKGKPLKFEMTLLVYFVKISKPNKGILAISEVEVLDKKGKNIAKGKNTASSSYKKGFKDKKAVDGKKGPESKDKQMWISKLQDDNFILIDLKGGHQLSKVIIHNTKDHNESVAGMKIALLDKDQKEATYKFWDKNDFKGSNKLNKTLKGLKCLNWHVKNEYAPPYEISGKYDDKKINSYELTDKEGNILKSEDKSTDGKDFKFSCKPTGYIDSYEHTSDMSGIKNLKCSTGKTDKKVYGKKGTFKKWKYKDYSKYGIDDHNYCRQSPETSTWGTKKPGSKLWCFTDKNVKGFCGKDGVEARNGQKLYELKKEFTFDMADKIPTEFKAYDNGGKLRKACWAKSGDFVYLSGLVKYKQSGLIPEDITIDELPEQVRPKNEKIFSCNTDNGIARIHVTEKGIIKFVKGNPKSIGLKAGWISLDGISFSVKEDKINIKLSSKFKSFSGSGADALKKGQLLKIKEYTGETEKPLASLTANMTVSVNIKAEENGRQVVFDKGYGGEGAMSIDPTGEIIYYYGKNGGQSGGYQTVKGLKLDLNNWTHLTIVRDLKMSNIRLFKNGKLVKKVTAKHSTAGKSPGPIKIGKGWLNKFKGEMKNLTFHNRALKGFEVKQLYSASASSEPAKYGGAKLTVRPNGLISLSGLIRITSPNIPENLGTIQEEARPNKILNFFVNQNSEQAMVTITPEGQLKVNGAKAKAGIIPLDGISYFTNKSEQF